MTRRWRSAPNTDLNIPEGLPLVDPDFRQPGPIDLTLGDEVYSCVITGELLELGPNKPLAQGTRLGYVITGYLNKETLQDRMLLMSQRNIKIQ